MLLCLPRLVGGKKGCSRAECSVSEPNAMAMDKPGGGSWEDLPSFLPELVRILRSVNISMYSGVIGAFELIQAHVKSRSYRCSRRQSQSAPHTFVVHGCTLLKYNLIHARVSL